MRIERLGAIGECGLSIFAPFAYALRGTDSSITRQFVSLYQDNFDWRIFKSIAAAYLRLLEQ